MSVGVLRIAVFGPEIGPPTCRLCVVVKAKVRDCTTAEPVATSAALTPFGRTSVMGVSVPVFWVGLPSIRGAKSTSEMLYLNDLFRTRVEKAGAAYIDVWDGFVDEAGRYSVQGPDYEGQIRRLRSADGVRQCHRVVQTQVISEPIDHARGLAG